MTDDERFLDWDEGEVKNRPQDGPDDWMYYCVTEEQAERRRERFAREWKEAQEAINKWYERSISKNEEV